MLAKSYLEEGQIQTAIQFLNRIDRNSDYNAQLVISQSLFIRALILVYDLQFTDALALLVRIRGMDFEKDEQLKEDITKLIKNIKIHQQANVIYDTTEDNPQIRDFKQATLQNLENYMNLARSLLKKG
jgi:tetratricopeptide (TPR) repeat protein